MILTSLYVDMELRGEGVFKDDVVVCDERMALCFTMHNKLSTNEVFQVPTSTGTALAVPVVIGSWKNFYAVPHAVCIARHPLIIFIE